MRQSIISLKSAICLLTERGIVLSQAEQFDILGLHKTFTQDILSFVLIWVNWWKNTWLWLKYTCTLKKRQLQGPNVTIFKISKKISHAFMLCWQGTYSGVKQQESCSILQFTPSTFMKHLKNWSKKFGSKKFRSKNSGPKNLSPKILGPKNVGPKYSGPKNLGPKNLGPKILGPKNSGPKNLAP